MGGSVSAGTSNYRTPMAKRARSNAETGTGCLGISVRSGGSTPVGFGYFPIGVSIYQGGSVSYDTSNNRTPMSKRALSKAETGTGLSGNIG